MNMAAKVATGGVLALIGFVVLKFVIGLVGVVAGFTFLLLFRILPIVLLIWLGVWLMRKIFGRNSHTTTT